MWIVQGTSYNTRVLDFRQNCIRETFNFSSSGWEITVTVITFIWKKSSSISREWSTDSGSPVGWSCRKPAHSTFQVALMVQKFTGWTFAGIDFTVFIWLIQSDELPYLKKEKMMDRITINSVFLNSTKEFRISVLKCVIGTLSGAWPREGTRLFRKRLLLWNLRFYHLLHVIFIFMEVEKQHSLTLSSWYL